MGGDLGFVVRVMVDLTTSITLGLTIIRQNGLWASYILCSLLHVFFSHLGEPRWGGTINAHSNHFPLCLFNLFSLF